MLPIIEKFDVIFLQEVVEKSWDMICEQFDDQLFPNL